MDDPSGDIKQTIMHAVNLLTAATETETGNPVLNGKTLAAMGVAEGTLRAVSSLIDLMAASPAAPTGPPGPVVRAHHIITAAATSDGREWEALAHAVVARRHWLSMSQPDVATAGGPSEQTQRRIENNQRSKYRAMVLARLEKALRWAPGTIQSILTGTITNLDDVITAPWARDAASKDHQQERKTTA